MPTEFRSRMVGGVTSYTLSIARELRKQGHYVNILCPGIRNTQTSYHKIPVYKISNFHINKTVRRALMQSFPLCIQRWEWMSSVRQFIKTSKKSYDIIEAPEWGSSALFTTAYPKTNVVVRLHKSLLQHHIDNGLPITMDLYLINILEMISIIRANGVTSPTKYMLSTHPMILSILRLKKIPFLIIKNGVTMPIKSNIQTSTPHKFVLTVGRIEKGKGVIQLVRAFARIAGKNPELHLLFIGRDTKTYLKGKWVRVSSLVKHEIAKYDLKKKIRLLSQMSQVKLNKYYQHCLFYVTASVGHENYPIALLDAQRWGKATIGFASGGVPEIILQDKSGLLCKEGDIQDLADKMLQLTQKAPLRKRLEEFTTQYTHCFDIKKTTKKTVSFYNRVVSTHLH